MCGICGFIGDARGVDTDAMLGKLAHRGPDDGGEWTRSFGDTTVWLGHRRLSIIDLSSAAHQPMVSRDGDVVLAFNGEIYNYAEIRADLVAAGYEFVGSGDTEVLLTAWRHWGEDAIARLRGMFAFALWNSRERCLWLVRDRMGEKPLYFAERNGTLFFASEIRSLLASDKIPRVLNPDGLASYLAFGSVTQPDTLVRDIKMLEAGHLLRFQAGKIHTRAYWTVPTERGAVTRAEALDIVRTEVDAAIERCMVADVPVGLLLSGGVDSTAILARLRARGHDNISTFSVGFDGPGADVSEAGAAKATAALFETQHCEVMLSPDTASTLIAQAFNAVDQPSVDGFNHYLVFHAIASAGFKVAITGQGADELFFGYARHTMHAASRRLAHFRAPSLVRSVASDALNEIAPRFRWASKGVSLLGAGTPDRLAYVARHTVFTSDEIDALRGKGPGTAESHVPNVSGDSALAKLYRMEISHFLPNQLLRDGDQMSMSQSLELRAPFVDHRLVEAVSSIPTSVKYVPGRQKALLVDAVDHPAVRRAADRPKSGFPFPLRRWVTEQMADRPFSPDMFGLDAARVRRVIEQRNCGQAFSRYWALLVLAEWMKANEIRAE
jgi:asparagine synthase (glutamine-hydrolysing)